MAIQTYLRKPTNGVSYGEKVIWTTPSADTLVIDFQSPFNLVALVSLNHPTTGAKIEDTGLLVTYPGVGKVQIDVGTATVANGTAVTVIAQNTFN